MKRMLLISLVLTGLIFRFCGANPLPTYDIVHVKVYPPEIGLWSFEEVDISGDTIITSNGIALIDSGVVLPCNWYEEPFILDSSNTSGFTINPEGDSVFIILEYLYSPVKFGQLFMYPPPIKGHRIKWWDGDYRRYSYDFANPFRTSRNVIINEVNVHCEWRDNANFIELYNLSSETVSLENWHIVCDTIFSFPDDASITAGGFYVVDEENFPSIFDVDYDADNLYLLDNQAGNGYTNCLIDQVGWSSDHGENVSFMRYPDGDVDTSYDNGWRDFRGYNDSTSYTFEDGFPTRGAPNRHDCPGFVVIGTAADSVDEATARIHWTDPIWDNLFEYSLLVKSLEAYPETPADGDIIYQGTGQEFVDETIIPETPNYYTVFARNAGGDFSTPTDESRTFVYYTSVGVDEQPLPEKYISLTCYPNPFNARTIIEYNLLTSTLVTIDIYDILGRKVETLANKQQLAGHQQVIWHAEDVPSGVYFYKLQAGDYADTRKMLLLK